MEVGDDGGVVGEWVVGVTAVGEGLARVLSWDQVVEDTETVATIGVGNIVPELS